MIGTTRVNLLMAGLTLACASHAFGSGDALVSDSAARTPHLAAEVSPESEQQAVASAKRALARGSNPWYNAETDGLEAMEFAIETPKQPREWAFGYLLEIVAWTVMGLALAGIIALLIWFVRNQQREARRERSAEDDLLVEPDQVEALPFLAERPRDDLLGHARRHYEAGNYSEAIIYLFSYQLVALDKGARIHLTKGKTNRQYLRELRGEGPMRGLLERTLITFEGVFFGRRKLDRAGFEACWLELPQFEQELRAPA